MLSPRNARTFYNAADALAPEAAEMDLAPALEARLASGSPAAARIFLRGLSRLERAPRWRLRGGFSWLERAERARILSRWDDSWLAGRRRVARSLARLVDDLVREAQSRDGA